MPTRIVMFRSGDRTRRVSKSLLSDSGLTLLLASMCAPGNLCWFPDVKVSTALTLFLTLI